MHLLHELTIASPCNLPGVLDEVSPCPQPCYAFATHLLQYAVCNPLSIPAVTFCSHTAWALNDLMSSRQDAIDLDTDILYYLESAGSQIAAVQQTASGPMIWCRGWMTRE